MNLERLVRLRSALVFVLLALCLAVALLAGALVVRASRPRKVLLVPGAPTEGVRTTGEVSDDTARAFALFYVARLDNYTPSTIESATEELKPLLAPGYWSRGAELLDNRVRVCREGRMSSQILLPAWEEVAVDREEGLAVVFSAVRRTFISDRPAQDGEVEYRIRLLAAHPGPGNPYGLLVSGQRIREAKHDP